MPQAVIERPTREKMNFMLDGTVIRELKMTIPDGQRSDFVNEAVQRALDAFGKKKALEGFEKLRKKMKLRIPIAEIIKAKNYGRA
ncbi:MAG: hypothetical protein WC846_00435 [Candidatus Gracilibacteria bacterium]|jgi:hypothetical protein